MISLLFVGAAALATAAGNADPGPASPSEPTLAEVKAAAIKYHDVKAALADGYIEDPSGMCETADMMGKPAKLGAMGVHYFRPDLLGITAPPNPRVDGNGTYTDFHKPAILLYEPQADGSMQLIGVEDGQVASATQKQQHKAVIQQVHPLHHDHCQPGKRCGQRKRCADRFE